MILPKKLFEIKRYEKLRMKANLFFCLLPFTLDNLEIIWQWDKNQSWDKSQIYIKWLVSEYNYFQLQLHLLLFLQVERQTDRHSQTAFLLTPSIISFYNGRSCQKPKGRKELYSILQIYSKERKSFKDKYIQVKDSVLYFQSTNQKQ